MSLRWRDKQAVRVHLQGCLLVRVSAGVDIDVRQVTILRLGQILARGLDIGFPALLVIFVRGHSR